MSESSAYVLLVLAAGSSSRFGSHKQLALVDGQPLLRYLLLKLTSGKWKTIVVLGGGAEDIRPSISDLTTDIIINEEWKEGMSASLQRGFSFVKEKYRDAKAVIVVLGDQVNLSSEDILTLIEKFDDHPDFIIATNYEGKPGVPVLFPKHIWSLIDALGGDEGARRMLDTRKDVVLVDNSRAFKDVDRPADL